MFLVRLAFRQKIMHMSANDEQAEGFIDVAVTQDNQCHSKFWP